MTRVLRSMLVAVATFGIAASGALADDDLLGGNFSCDRTTGIQNSEINLNTGGTTKANQCAILSPASPANCIGKIEGLAEELADEGCDTRVNTAVDAAFVSYLCKDDPRGFEQADPENLFGGDRAIS